MTEVHARIAALDIMLTGTQAKVKRTKIARTGEFTLMRAKLESDAQLAREQTLENSIMKDVSLRHHDAALQHLAGRERLLARVEEQGVMYEHRCARLERAYDELGQDAMVVSNSDGGQTLERLHHV